MSLIVQKFGGTSVATIKHIENVAQKVLSARSRGHEVVVVVSAMGKETDRLDDLARQVGIKDCATHRELDVLLSTGEQVTIALLAMTLLNLGCQARSYTGGQVKILTHLRAGGRHGIPATLGAVDSLPWLSIRRNFGECRKTAFEGWIVELIHHEERARGGETHA